MTITKIFYAVYDIDRKLFKARTGLPWTKEPVQVYDTLPKANAVMKRHQLGRAPLNLVIKEISIAWNV